MATGASKAAKKRRTMVINPLILLNPAVRKAMEAVQTESTHRWSKYEEWRQAERFYQDAVFKLRAAVMDADETLRSDTNWVTNTVNAEPKTAADVLKDHPEAERKLLESLLTELPKN